MGLAEQSGYGFLEINPGNAHIGLSAPDSTGGGVEKKARQEGLADAHTEILGCKVRAGVALIVRTARTHGPTDGQRSAPWNGLLQTKLERSCSA